MAKREIIFKLLFGFGDFENKLFYVLSSPESIRAGPQIPQFICPGIALCARLGPHDFIPAPAHKKHSLAGPMTCYAFTILDTLSTLGNQVKRFLRMLCGFY
jgi:hypothetical protein